MSTVFLRNGDRRTGNLRNSLNAINFPCSCGTQVGSCERVVFENENPDRFFFFS